MYIPATTLNRLLELGEDIAERLEGAPGLDITRSAMIASYREAAEEARRERKYETPGPKARRTDPDTSRLAALKNEPRRGTQRAKLLYAIVARGSRGATAEEAAREAGIRLNAASTRMSELVRGEHIIATDERRETSGGASAIVYRSAKLV